jgi:hypothetical protein
MAKKTRRARRADSVRDLAPPRVPYSVPVVTGSGSPPSAPTAAIARPRTGRPTRSSSETTTARLTAADMGREFAYVRQDLKKIAILATSLFAILIALAFILPQVLG